MNCIMQNVAAVSPFAKSGSICYPEYIWAFWNSTLLKVSKFEIKNDINFSHKNALQNKGMTKM